MRLELQALKNVKFCPACGTRLAPAPRSASSAARSCKRTGREYENMFCTKCGRKLPDGRRGNPEPVSPGLRKHAGLVCEYES